MKKNENLTRSILLLSKQIQKQKEKSKNHGK